MKMRLRKRYLIIISMIVLGVISALYMFLMKSRCVSLSIANEVSDMLEYEGLEECKITKMGCYDSYSFVPDKVIVQTQEVDDYIEEQVMTNRELIEIIDRTYIKEGDLLEVDYKIFVEGEEIFRADNDIWTIGLDDCNYEVDDILLKSEIGDEFFAKTDIYYNDKVVEAEIEGVILNNYEYEEIIDMDSKICEVFNVNCVQDAYDYVETIIYEEKKSKSEIEMKNDFIQYVLEKSKYELDESAIEKYAATNITYYQNCAFANGLTMEQYANQYEDFYGQMYEEAEYNVKAFLLIGAIASKENIEVTQSQFENVCQEYNYSEKYLKEHPEIEIYIYYSLLEANVFDFLAK